VKTQISERRLHNRGTAASEPSRLQLEVMITGTYREMPGLSLHLGQAARLFGLRPAMCEVVLDDMVRGGFLRRADDGQYKRA
jgi:hypothetical protein